MAPEARGELSQDEFDTLACSYAEAVELAGHDPVGLANDGLDRTGDEITVMWKFLPPRGRWRERNGGMTVTSQIPGERS